jgi:hypothetical protein
MEQLNLNYGEIKKVANRDYVRKNFKTSSKVAYWTKIKDISIREGFNNREDYGDIEEFAATLMSGYVAKENKLYLITPMNLDVLPNGVSYIFRGHRRYRGLVLNIEKGLLNWDTEVQFFPTEADVTELNRKADQILSNNCQKGFTPIEMAKTAWDLKHNFSSKPKSNDEIAKILALSRQTIDNLIIIHESPAELRNEMKLGNMSMTKALEFIRNQRKIEKQSDQTELDAAQTSMYKSQTKDELAGELKELEELENMINPELSEEEIEERAMQRKVKDDARAAKELEELMAISDEVKVSPEVLYMHIGKKLSADVFRMWEEDFVDEDTAEVVTISKKNKIIPKNTVLTEDAVEIIVEAGVETILVYRKGCEPVAPSVITEPVAGKEKDIYDSSRPEIAQVQNVIKLLDRLDVITQKFDIPEGAKKDISNIVQWCQNDLNELRTWVHKNKVQNKAR